MAPTLNVPILTIKNFKKELLDLSLPDKNKKDVYASAVYYQDDALYVQTAQVRVTDGVIDALDDDTVTLMNMIDEQIKDIIVLKSVRMFRGKKFDRPKIDHAFEQVEYISLDDNTKLFSHRGTPIDYDDHIKDGQCILELTDIFFIGATIQPQWRVAQFRASAKRKTALADYAFHDDQTPDAPDDKDAPDAPDEKEAPEEPQGAPEKNPVESPEAPPTTPEPFFK